MHKNISMIAAGSICEDTCLTSISLWTRRLPPVPPAASDASAKVGPKDTAGDSDRQSASPIRFLASIVVGLIAMVVRFITSIIQLVIFSIIILWSTQAYLHLVRMAVYQLPYFAHECEQKQPGGTWATIPLSTSPSTLHLWYLSDLRPFVMDWALLHM
jgi:hypothetical protein